MWLLMPAQRYPTPGSAPSQSSLVRRARLSAAGSLRSGPVNGGGPAGAVCVGGTDLVGGWVVTPWGTAYLNGALPSLTVGDARIATGPPCR